MNWPKMPRVVNLPRTTTLLALGVLWGCHQQGQFDWSDALFIVLGAYFGRRDGPAQPTGGQS
jgi:hypothetical protein